MDRDSLSFDDWLASIDPERDMTDRRRWLRHQFELLGPVDAESIDVAYELELAGALRTAIELARSDLPDDPTRSLTYIDEPGARGIAYGYSATFSSPMTHSPPWRMSQLIVDVADYVQEHVSEERMRVWPTCTNHGLGLHPKVANHGPVWRCSHGPHDVAVIGQLHASSRE